MTAYDAMQKKLVCKWEVEVHMHLGESDTKGFRTLLNKKWIN